MGEKIVGNIPKILYKVYLILKDRFDPKPVITDEEKTWSEVCMKLMDNPTTKVFDYREQNQKFIINDEKRTYIIIEGNYVSLINSEHSFTTYIDGYEVYGKVIERFNGIVQKNRVDLIETLNKEHKNSLDKIINSLG
jgi:hypothetical protein